MEDELRPGATGFFADLTGNKPAAFPDSREQQTRDRKRPREEEPEKPAYQRNIVEPGTVASPAQKGRTVGRDGTIKVTFGKDASGKQLQQGIQWLELGLCKALTRAVTHVGYIAPTPVQASVIPQAIRGDDVCARAVTGSGKTCAFLLPLLHHLATVSPVRQGKSFRRFIRSLILVPSRELGNQVLDNAKRLSQFARTTTNDDIRCALVCGGMNLQSQETELAAAPELIVATPGRLLDLCYNYSNMGSEGLQHRPETSKSSAFTSGKPNRTRAIDLCGIEMLIIDECDKMLTVLLREQVSDVIGSFLPPRLASQAGDEAFMAQQKGTREQSKELPASKVPYQMMLFSATMTQDVDDFATEYLRNDGRVCNVDVGHVALAAQLRQHFIRIDDSALSSAKADEQAAAADGEEPTSRHANELTHIKTQYLVAACKKYYFHRGTIIFCKYKTTVHRLAILFNELGLAASELNGNQSQEQRFAAIESFRKGEVTFLIATDVASRGLDVEDISTVVNFDMPPNLTAYIHRVGRTARIGKAGVAVSLVREVDDADIMRKILSLSSLSTPDDSNEGKLEEMPLNQVAAVKRRTVPQEALADAKKLIDEAFVAVKEVLAAEELEKQIEEAEKKLTSSARTTAAQRGNDLKTTTQTAGKLNKRTSILEQQNAGASKSGSALDVIAPTAKRQWTLSDKEKKRREEVAKQNFREGVDDVVVKLQEEMAECDRQQNKFFQQQKDARRRDRSKKEQVKERERLKRKEERQKHEKKLQAGVIKKMKQKKVKQARKQKRAEERQTAGKAPWKRKDGKQSMKKNRHKRKKKH